jgi:shikimate kinase
LSFQLEQSKTGRQWAAGLFRLSGFMKASQNLYLVGPMGSGKTAVGKQLARLLKMPFFDSDHEIELATNADIPLIFEREGEAGFRRREQDMITQLTQRDGIVLATGGGAVLNETSRELLRARGWIAFLETSIEHQAARAARTRHRPMLHGHDPQQRLLQLWQVREPLYRAMADFTICTDNRRVASVADAIAAAFRASQPVSAPV